MKFSVIIPIYNADKYLSDCLRSVLDQSYADFELIAVDDGSTDGSAELCRKFAAADDRMRIVSKENGGVTSARKAGVAAARGKYIVCIDADDIVSHDYLKTFSDAADTYDADIIQCGMLRFTDVVPTADESETYFRFYDKADIAKEIFPSLIENARAHSYTSAVVGKAVKADLFKRVQSVVDDRLRIGEDSIVIKCCIYSADTVAATDRKLYYYRRNQQSATGAIKPRDWNEPKITGDMYDRFIDLSYGDFKEQYCRGIAHMLFNVCVSQFAGEKDYKQVKSEIICNIKAYKSIIKCARFKCFSGKLMLFALRTVRWGGGAAYEKILYA